MSKAKQVTIQMHDYVESAMIISAKVGLHKGNDVTTKVGRIEMALELFNKAVEQGKISIGDLVNLK
jgi:hypothetical protein